MAIRKVNFIEGEFYHVYNRGNSRAIIFHDQQDYKRFQQMMYVCNGTKLFKFKEFIKSKKNIFDFERGERIVQIAAYVLMPNHFHIFITPNKINQKQSTDKNLQNNLSIYMKRLTAAYTMYYNHKYKKTGSLFEGKFKAEHVSTGEYFKYLFSYIHLNPMKLFQKDWRENGIEDMDATNNFLQNYSYSSFHSYFLSAGKAGGYMDHEGKIVDTKIFYEKIPRNIDLNREIFDWLDYKTII